jgi:hypothetical protein
MPYDTTLLAEVGRFARAAQYNSLNDNIEWVRDLADEGHDFDPTTGTGYHKSQWDDPLRLGTLRLWWDATDSVIRWKAGSNPATESDGTSTAMDLVDHLADYDAHQDAISQTPALIATNRTIQSGYNALSAGPITIDDGVTITIELGALWAIV